MFNIFCFNMVFNMLFYMVFNRGNNNQIIMDLISGDQTWLAYGNSLCTEVLLGQLSMGKCPSPCFSE